MRTNTNPNPNHVVGVVLAGGRGTRLFGPEGGSKGLYPLNGRPLIDYSLATIRQAGVDEIALVVREEDHELRSRYPDFAQILDLGEGTLSAILAAAEYAVGRRAGAIISSCDLVCAPGAAKALVDCSSRNPEWSACFGITLIANDQTPIWVHTNHSGQIVDYGKGIRSSVYAFASIRFAKHNFLKLILARSKSVSSDVNTDTKLMRQLILSEKVVVGAIDIGQAIDVDDDVDAKTATDIAWSFGHS